MTTDNGNQGRRVAAGFRRRNPSHGQKRTELWTDADVKTHPRGDKDEFSDRHALRTGLTETRRGKESAIGAGRTADDGDTKNPPITRGIFYDGRNRN